MDTFRHFVLRILLTTERGLSALLMLTVAGELALMCHRIYLLINPFVVIDTVCMMLRTMPKLAMLLLLLLHARELNQPARDDLTPARDAVLRVMLFCVFTCLSPFVLFSLWLMYIDFEAEFYLSSASSSQASRTQVDLYQCFEAFMFMFFMSSAALLIWLAGSTEDVEVRGEIPRAPLTLAQHYLWLVGKALRMRTRGNKERPRVRVE